LVFLKVNKFYMIVEEEEEVEVEVGLYVGSVGPCG
jgi:hypothetical protein